MKHVFVALIISFFAQGAQASSVCKKYWDARKTGVDWPIQPPLGQYDQMCASNIVIAQDWQGNCGVHVVSSSGYASLPDGIKSHIAISWFSCNVGGQNLKFGDYIEGELKEKCIISCHHCATGQRTLCTTVFMPKGEVD